MNYEKRKNWDFLQNIKIKSIVPRINYRKWIIFFQKIKSKSAIMQISSQTWKNIQKYFTLPW